MHNFSVTEFVGFLNSALSEAVFPDGVAIEGEVAEYRVSQGKWIWFLVKDNGAVLSCFGTTWKLRQPLEDGMQVRIYGQPKVHERSGKFSVVVDRVEPVGEGALRRAYDLLRRSLEAEGIFDPARKRPLPKFPRRIGLIASRESAAYSDFLRILGNRWSDVEVNSVHVQVQGRDAVGDILAAFAHFAAHPELADVLVLTRGGGSLEDLQAFNSEEVARAVFSSPMPIVVGVGHERDETLADFAADVRASTPSNAAEIVVPDRNEVGAAVESLRRRLTYGMDTAVGERVAEMDRAVRVMERGIMSAVSSFRHRQRDLTDVFGRFAERVAMLSHDLRRIEPRLLEAPGPFLSRLNERLADRRRLLESLDPRAVLQRGYSIVRLAGRPLREASRASVGDTLDIELHRGRVGVRVESVVRD
ncbi:MAG: exodeoxyribonuclease VII large subunit [bacterium]